MPSTNTSKRLDELLTAIGCLDDIAPYDTPVVTKRVGEHIGQSAMRRSKRRKKGGRKPTTHPDLKEESAMMEYERNAQQAAATQKELLDTYEQATRHWVDRMKSEMALWADLGSKLTGTRSITEAFDAYGKCVSTQMKMTTEDAQHLFNDWQQMTQKINGMWLRGGMQAARAE